jgi:hypothetical protein
VRKSIALTVRQAGQRTHRNQYRAVIAAPIVGENKIGLRLSWRWMRAGSPVDSIARPLIAHCDAQHRHKSRLTLLS